MVNHFVKKSSHLVNYLFIIKYFFLYSALCEVFDRADITRDGTISIAEYMALCEEYGVRLDEADIKEIGDIADSDGEIHRMDFILHVKNSHLLKHFETVDPLSRIHWKKKADLAFRFGLTRYYTYNILIYFQNI